MIQVTPDITLHDDEISVTFVRSPGAGGQNVNKVATAVQLRFDARNARELPGDVRARLLRLAGDRATKAGEIVITAHRFRTQLANRRDAIDRLVALIRRAAVRPRARLATRPHAGAVRARLDTKRRRSDVKRQRRRPADAD